MKSEEELKEMINNLELAWNIQEETEEHRNCIEQQIRLIKWILD